MKGTPEKSPSAAWLKAAQDKGAGGLVRVDRQEADFAIEQHKKRAAAISTASAKIEYAAQTAWLLAGLTSITVFTPIFLLNAYMTGRGADKARESFVLANRRSIEQLERNIHDRLVDSRREKFAENQKKLIALAGQELKDGRLLDVQALSYLAAIPPHCLKDASDQLAITVLQARQMIACVRRADAQGTPLAKAHGKPATFARMAEHFKSEMELRVRFNPQSEKHRGILRARLWSETPRHIGEDSAHDNWPQPEVPGLAAKMEALKALEIGKKGKWARLLAGPLFWYADIRKMNALKNAEIPEFCVEIEIPPLLPVENFESLLARYESESGERLDLPALRGWGPPKALPGPLAPR